MDKDYRMTVSRDRLAEFRRNPGNSDVELINSYNRPYQQQTLNAYNQNNLAPYYDGHSTTYQPPQPLPSSYTHSTRAHRYQDIDLQPSSHLKESTTEAFFKNVEDIKWYIAKINENVTEIESLHTASLSSMNGERVNGVNQTLEQLVAQTSQLNKETKERIKELEMSNAKLRSNHPSDLQMRQTQLQALRKKFIETIQRYQDIERTFEKKQRQRIERQILIVKPDASPHEIESVIDSDEPPQIFAHSLLNSSRTGNATQVLNEVQTRHKDIKKIEKTILELHQLFLDMQTMVEMQQETIMQIEKTADDTVYQLEEGNKHVSVAIKSAKMTRKRKWCCFIIFIILLAVAGILIWWFAFPKSHSS
ncbi:MAG: t-SNARE [Benjaminiella poitrasii]|nr:MAG: t-SNARE [Benjaminiella poitrasii]